MNTNSAGARPEKVNLNRPWQMAVGAIIADHVCPYCTTPQKEVPCHHNGWRTFHKKFTRQAWGLLIIPKACPDEAALTSLGGEVAIRQVFEISLDLAGQFGHQGEIELCVHVGWFAGQTVRHTHWHHMPAHPRNLCVKTVGDYPTARWVGNFGRVSAFTAGQLAGRLELVPYEQMVFSAAATDLARGLSTLITKGNEIFRSKQGHSPHYTVSVRYNADTGQFRYASYTPILYQLGGPERGVGDTEGGEYPLPWSHEFTAKYYLGETP